MPEFVPPENELLMLLVRASARRTGSDADDAVCPPVPADAQSAAVVALKATLTAGNPLSGRQLETRFGLTRAEAARVRQMAAASANGTGPG